MSEFMQAVVTTSNEAQPLEVMTIPAPVVSDEDVLVRVKAVAVNPVDGKQRQAAVANKSSHVLGFDATGEVVAVGAKVTMNAALNTVGALIGPFLPSIPVEVSSLSTPPLSNW